MTFRKRHVFGICISILFICKYMWIMEDQHINFWNIVERDLAVVVPDYIKNTFKYAVTSVKNETILFLILILFYSLCSFNNAIVFRSVTEDSVVYVEKFVRDKLLKTVTMTENEKIHFFGIWHKSPAEEFCISMGDRYLINEIAAYADRIIKSRGARYFQMQPNEKLQKCALKKLRILSCGRYYASSEHNSEEKENNMPRTKKNDGQLTRELHKRVADIFCTNEKYNVDTIQDLLPINLIHVSTAANRVKGQITCLLCKNENLEKTVKVSYYIGANSEYWVLSNFKKHLFQHNFQTAKKHGKRNQARDHMYLADGKEEFALKAPEDLVDDVKEQGREAPELFIDDEEREREQNDHTVNDNQLEKKQMNGEQQKVNIDVALVANSLFIENELQLDDAFVKKSEASLYNSISDQNMKNIKFVLNQKMEEKRMEFDQTEIASSALYVVEINKDGNCLFGTLAHQLFHLPPNGTAHMKAVRKLRADAINYIRNNVFLFQFCINARMIETKTESVDAFLLHLEKNGVWGGIECLKAIHHVHQANIIIFNENGEYYASPPLNFEFDRIVMIAYRYSSNGINRSHYDSISQLGQSDICQCVESIVKRHVTMLQLTNLNETIEIDDD